MIGEGFDDARLDTLFLTLPVSWRGTIAQYVGRLHRLHDRKREVRVYDYADLNVPMLARMFDRRCRGYEALGYTILLPGSAVPGWPAEVPLPVDPQWKSDLCGQRPPAGARRRRRAAGATLFVDLSDPSAADAEGAHAGPQCDRGLSVPPVGDLAAAAGRFRLNAELPIPFDGAGPDGSRSAVRRGAPGGGTGRRQHLAGEEAYRRDRRKDLLLQEHGYFVLRFLADDVGRNLDLVLDTILRALARSGRGPRSGQFGSRELRRAT